MTTPITIPECATTPRSRLIGETAPALSARTTKGPIRFPDDYRGRWVILFSHPADFTSACTNEFMTFANMMPEFKALNCRLVDLSIDSHFAHIAWLRTIQKKISVKNREHVEVTIPLIADVKMDVTRTYGMAQPGTSDTQPVRAVFLIDPKAIIREVVYYPLSNGLNFSEIKHLLIALQTTDAHGCATPADWQSGDDGMVPPPGSGGPALDRMPTPAPDSHVPDGLVAIKKLPKKKLKLQTAAQV